MPIEQMNISLPPRMARFIRGKVKAGQYTNASEVVRDAVRHMQEAEAVRKEQLTASEYKDIRQRVQQGVKDFEEGRYEEFDEDGLRQHFLTASPGRAFVWSRDSGTLYSVRRADDHFEVIAIDPISGAVRVINRTPADVGFATPDTVGLRFTLAADGQSFLATVVRRPSDLWILENFAPRRGLLDWVRSRW